MQNMWEITDDNVNCDECSANYFLPPPKFELPPPPIPPTLENFVKCNEDEIFNQMSNWNNDMCAAIPVFGTNGLSSPMIQALTLVGVFAFILLLVIAFSMIYVRRLMNQKDDGCKELKNLVKHTLQHSESNSSDNSARSYLAQPKYQNKNFYEECGGRCNQYTIRRAHDFVSYVPTNNTSMSSVSETANSIIGVGSVYMEPLRYPDAHHNGYLGYTDLDKCYNHSNTNTLNGYIQPPSLIAPSPLHSHKMNSQLAGGSLSKGYIIHTSPSIKQSCDLYSIPYEDIEELPGYSRADTGYGGSSEEGASNNEHNVSHISRRSSNNSNHTTRRCSLDSTNSNNIDNHISNSNNINNNSNSNNNNVINQDSNSVNYPEYVEIDLVLPNLVESNENR
ncbi:GATA zinc finger domain-containing protein 15-like [Condylostylus longicornis]|uniref:GATA zinc finger domain-containing protein 15-like n=1 Tax=Condylostylus longicornis TaxID=2530218 RepID=UPI00244DCED6|nr:GATA zinc finger domain-containing protein 15-like [Condylostylus longicornis]